MLLLLLLLLLLLFIARSFENQLAQEVVGALRSVHKPLETYLDALASEAVMVIVHAAVEKRNDTIVAHNLLLDLGVARASLSWRRLKQPGKHTQDLDLDARPGKLVGRFLHRWRRRGWRWHWPPLCCWLQASSLETPAEVLPAGFRLALRSAGSTRGFFATAASRPLSKAMSSYAASHWMRYARVRGSSLIVVRNSKNAERPSLARSISQLSAGNSAGSLSLFRICA